MFGGRFLFATVILVASVATGQQQPTRALGGELPSAPSAMPLEHSRQPHPLADDRYVPLTKDQKLHQWLRKTLAPSTFVSAGVDVTFSGITNSMRYCCGIGAWGMQYGASMGDTETRNFFGKLLFPTLLKQDPRYFPKRRGGFIARSWYAATRVLVTRNDDGREVFNSSEFLAIALSRALSNAYYPGRDRTWSSTGNSILGALQGDASGFLLQEFMPDMKRMFKRHAPKPLVDAGSRLPVSRYLQTD